MKFFVLIFLMLFGPLAGSSPSIAAAAVKVPHKSLLPASRKFNLKGQDNLLPAESGAGIVICEPVTIPAASEAVNFGAGCAIWLQFVVGGQPQFGKTPLWASLDRACTEMGRSDLRLSSTDALNLAPILGVTHTAIGTLRGTEPHLMLTYRLVRVPSGISVGTAITLSGTREQIAAGLPGMARKLVGDLGGTAAALPASTDLSARDLQTLGQERWLKSVCTKAERTALEAMTVQSPVAGLINLSRHGGGYTAHSHTAVETLLTQAADNPFVWGVITQRDNLLLLAHAAQLSALAARYPHNSILGMVQAYRAQLIQDHASEIQAVGQIVKDAPRSPDGWNTCGTIISSVAGDERQGRVYDAISPSEAEKLGRLYVQAEACDLHAVQLDPHYAVGWRNLAVSATFNSHSDLADRAIHMALAFSQRKAGVYDWALEMYQPKWNDDPAKLTTFAHLAASDLTLDADEVLNVARELRSSGYPELRTKVLNDFIARKRHLLALNPDTGQDHFELAVVLEAAHDSSGALAEYQRAAVLLPENASVHYHLGDLLSTSGNPAQAEIQLREALRLDPDFPDAHFHLSEVLQIQNSQSQNNDKEAERELKTTLALDPTYAEAYRDLAVVFQVQNNLVEAISCYQSAIRFGDIRYPNSYLNMIEVMDKAGQYDQVLMAGTEALKLYGDSALGDYPDGSNVYDLMAAADLHQQKWDKAIAMCQAHLSHKVDDPVAHEQLAESYLGAGHIADAQSEWRKVITYNNDTYFTTDQQKARAQDFLKKYP